MGDPPYRKLSRLSHPFQCGRFFSWDGSQVSEVVELVLESFGSCQRAGFAGFGILHESFGLAVEVPRGVYLHDLDTTSKLYYIQGMWRQKCERKFGAGFDGSIRIREWDANGLLHVARGVANYAGGRSATNMQNGCPAGSA